MGVSRWILIEGLEIHGCIVQSLCKSLRTAISSATRMLSTCIVLDSSGTTSLPLRYCLTHSDIRVTGMPVPQARRIYGFVIAAEILSEQ